MTRISRFLLSAFATTLSFDLLLAQGLEVVPVLSKQVENTLRLPGELLPYQQVAIAARVTGFVEKVNVDRGSRVLRGDTLIVLSAPEMEAQLAEAEARAQGARSHRDEADARIQGLEITLKRLREAASTPGAVAGNEVVQAEKALEGARALRRALDDAARAAMASVDAIKKMQDYLQVTAPFDGVITERNAHPGALAGPGTPPASGSLLRLEQISRLRLILAVPEAAVAGITRGQRVSFFVPAYPGQSFQGDVARVSGSIDPKTRTMPVELDVPNPQGLLAPGMYPEARWIVRRPNPSLLVPPSTIVTTTERTFVIRVRAGRTEWVNVTRGLPAGDLVEVFGALSPGDEVLRRGTDEIRDNSPVQVIRRAASHP